MNKFVCSALALAAASSVGSATDGSDEWLGLDQEINALTSSVSPQGGGVDVGALIRSSYLNVDDDLTESSSVSGSPGFNDDEIGGFVFQDVDVWLEGEIGDFDWRVNIDFDDGEEDDFDKGTSLDDLFDILDFGSGGTGGGAQLEDAYADWDVNENFSIMWGQFKFPTLLSNQVDPNHQIFIDRTILGQLFDDWDLGAMVHGLSLIHI